MIKQDYLIRMIQEIVSLIVHALLKKQPVRHKDWEAYESTMQQTLGLTTTELMGMTADELLIRYREDDNHTDKLELAAVSMLKLAGDTADNRLLSAKLRQNGLELLKHLQTHGNAYSLQRAYLINLIEINGEITNT